MIQCASKGIFKSCLHRTHFTRMKSSEQISALKPPSAVSKMTVWQPELFNKTVEVPFLIVNENLINKMQKQFKSYILKIPNFKPVQKAALLTNEKEKETTLDEDVKSKRIILDPDKIKKFEDFSCENKQLLINTFNVRPENDFGKLKIKLDYTNYAASSMLKGK